MEHYFHKDLLQYIRSFYTSTKYTQPFIFNIYEEDYEQIKEKHKSLDIAYIGNMNLVQCIIKKGKRDNGNYGLQCAMQNESINIEIIKVLHKSKVDNNINYFIGEKNIKIVQKLIQESSIKLLEDNLFYYNYTLELIKLLIEKGISLNKLLIHSLQSLNNNTIIQYLIEKGANDFNHGLIEAEDNIEYIKLMIENGADNFDEKLKEICFEDVNDYYNNDSHDYIQSIYKYLIQQGATYCSQCQNERHIF